MRAPLRKSALAPVIYGISLICEIIWVIYGLYMGYIWIINHLLSGMHIQLPQDPRDFSLECSEANPGRRMSSSMVSSQVRRRVSKDCGLVLMTWISTVQMVVFPGDVVFSY